MVEPITITIVPEDFEGTLEEHFAANFVKLIYKKLKEAGVPMSPLGEKPIVKEGELFRVDFEDKIEFTWQPDAVDDSSI